MPRTMQGTRSPQSTNSCNTPPAQHLHYHSLFKYMSSTNTDLTVTQLKDVDMVSVSSQDAQKQSPQGGIQRTHKLDFANVNSFDCVDFKKHTISKVHICPVCKNTWHGRIEFRDHFALEHPQKVPEFPSIAVLKDKHRCKSCKVNFSRKKSLMEHNKRYHAKPKCSSLKFVLNSEEPDQIPVGTASPSPSRSTQSPPRTSASTTPFPPYKASAHVDRPMIFSSSEVGASSKHFDEKEALVSKTGACNFSAIQKGNTNYHPIQQHTTLVWTQHDVAPKPSQHSSTNFAPEFTTICLDQNPSSYSYYSSPKRACPPYSAQPLRTENHPQIFDQPTTPLYHSSTFSCSVSASPSASPSPSPTPSPASPSPKNCAPFSFSKKNQQSTKKFTINNLLNS